MVEGATVEDVKSSVGEEPVKDKFYLNPISGGLSQFTENPLQNMDFARLLAGANVKFAENKSKKGAKREFFLKKLFLQHAMKYQNKWESLADHPKQIRQKPAWFDLALGTFTSDELSFADKQKIKNVFNTLWEYRDRYVPERVMGEEESVRQYGVSSPYFEQPEAAPETQPPSPMNIPSQPIREEYTQSLDQGISPAPEEEYLGIRKIQPTERSYLSEYVVPVQRSVLFEQPAPPVAAPAGESPMGMLQPQRIRGGSGNSVFNMGRNMLSGIRGGSALQNIATQRAPTLPNRSIQVRPDETITVAEPLTPAMQRKQKTSKSLLNRKVNDVSMNLQKFRSIELPTLPSKMTLPVKHAKKKPGLNISLPVIQSNKKSSLFLGKKLTLQKSNMSHDIRNNVSGVVDGIKALRNQVKGEFKTSGMVNSINIKKIKAKKIKDHKDLNVLNKLKLETHDQLSRDALECKMIPKLKAQCDKVFSRNHITNEVTKFRNEFKDIGKMVPTVKGDKAKINEIAMVGRSIDHGVDGAHVADVRAMYKNSGTTKQMHVGTMDYDYSFITGKRKRKAPVAEYYDEEE